MNVLICANSSKEKSRLILPQVIEKLLEYSLVPFLPDNVRLLNVNPAVVRGKRDELIEQCDVFLTVGGDGTILHWGKLAAKAKKRLLGINTGRLGFMATLEGNELHKLSQLESGDYSISRRILMNISKNNEHPLPALNDVVFYKSTCSKLPEFLVYVNSVQVTKIRADGLIFSTPTGSTAYALSAGGPIIDPELDCIEFTPLCAHTLFSRPMIFNGSDRITVKFHSYEGSQVFVSTDGNDGIPLSDGDEILIEKSELFLELIDLDGGSFYKSVNGKLMQPLK